MHLASAFALTVAATGGDGAGTAIGVAVISLIGTITVAMYTVRSKRDLQDREAATAARTAQESRASEERLKLLEHSQAVALRGLEARERERLDASTRASVARRYREPLLIAAIELYGRLRNIASRRFLETFLLNGEPHERRYAVDHTLYQVAQYFCWVEIIRKEVQFLEPEDEEVERELVARLQAVNDAFSSDDLTKIMLHRLRSFPDACADVIERIRRGEVSAAEPTFRLFRGEQRALGELLIVPTATPSPDRPRWGSLGYAEFHERLSEQRFSEWFQALREDLDRLSQDVDGKGARVIVIEAAIVDLLNELDPASKRSPHHEREVLPLLGKASPSF